MSRRSDLGDGPSVASRAIDCLVLRFGTSFARRRVSGVARTVAARSSNAPRMLAVPSLVQWFRSGSDGVSVLAAMGCGDVCAVSSPEKLTNGRDYAADDSTAILDS